MNNIEALTLRNDNYRKVIQTTEQIQLVLMSLNVGEDIPTEVHDITTQFIRVERGSGMVVIDDKITRVSDGDFVIIPARKHHYIANISSTQPLKLYTIYAPPEHPPNRLNKRQPKKDL